MDQEKNIGIGTFGYIIVERVCERIWQNLCNGSRNASIKEGGALHQSIKYILLEGTQDLTSVIKEGGSFVGRVWEVVLTDLVLDTVFEAILWLFDRRYTKFTNLLWHFDQMYTKIVNYFWVG